MKEIADQIRLVVESAKMQLPAIEESAANLKPASDKWSKKEILGHLIDSAANNHQRFVRAVYNEADKFPTYKQNDWVRIQQYNDSSWKSLIELWTAYNYHLSDLIKRMPVSCKSSPCNIGKTEPVTLEFVVVDYLRHLKHHINKLIEKTI
jgi:hypothetical protein